VAQQIKFRLTAAKVGVSMALVALVGGVVEKLRPAPSQLQVTRASAPGRFLKAQASPQKIQSELQKVDQKIVSLDSKWLKLTSALKSTDQKMIKLWDTAQKTFLKLDQANSEFLKIGSAAKVYLKQSTAKNEFVQGRGGVASAAIAAVPAGKTTPLLKSPDGSLVVSLTTSPDNVQVHIDNTTGELLPAVQILDNAIPTTQNLQPGPNVITLDGPTAAHHLQLQTFGDGSSNAALTLVLSSEASSSNPNEPQVVAQMLIGLL
jgi:hypothetical protein